jgi:hypothetical protein
VLGSRVAVFGLGVVQSQQELLGQMLIEGYGCDADPEAGQAWIERARCGVGCGAEATGAGGADADRGVRVRPRPGGSQDMG